MIRQKRPVVIVTPRVPPPSPHHMLPLAIGPSFSQVSIAESPCEPPSPAQMDTVLIPDSQPLRLESKTAVSPLTPSGLYAADDTSASRDNLNAEVSHIGVDRQEVTVPTSKSGVGPEEIVKSSSREASGKDLSGKRLFREPVLSQDSWAVSGQALVSGAPSFLESAEPDYESGSSGGLKPVSYFNRDLGTATLPLHMSLGGTVLPSVEPESSEGSQAPLTLYLQPTQSDQEEGEDEVGRTQATVLVDEMPEGEPSGKGREEVRVPDSPPLQGTGGSGRLVARRRWSPRKAKVSVLERSNSEGKDLRQTGTFDSSSQLLEFRFRPPGDMPRSGEPQVAPKRDDEGGDLDDVVDDSKHRLSTTLSTTNLDESNAGEGVTQGGNGNGRGRRLLLPAHAMPGHLLHRTRAGVEPSVLDRPPLPGQAARFQSRKHNSSKGRANALQADMMVVQSSQGSGVDEELEPFSTRPRPASHSSGKCQKPGVGDRDPFAFHEEMDEEDVSSEDEPGEGVARQLPHYSVFSFESQPRAVFRPPPLTSAEVGNPLPVTRLSELGGGFLEKLDPAPAAEPLREKPEAPTHDPPSPAIMDMVPDSGTVDDGGTVVRPQVKMSPLVACRRRTMTRQESEMKDSVEVARKDEMDDAESGVCRICQQSSPLIGTADTAQWIQCDDCDCWIHGGCDGIADVSLFDDARHPGVRYSCAFCRSERDVGSGQALPPTSRKQAPAILPHQSMGTGKRKAKSKAGRVQKAPKVESKSILDKTELNRKIPAMNAHGAATSTLHPAVYVLAQAVIRKAERSAVPAANGAYVDDYVAAAEALWGKVAGKAVRRAAAVTTQLNRRKSAATALVKKAFEEGLVKGGPKVKSIRIKGDSLWSAFVRSQSL